VRCRRINGGSVAINASLPSNNPINKHRLTHRVTAARGRLVGHNTFVNCIQVSLLKPNTAAAMQSLIDQIRQRLPFDLNQARLCRGPCHGCPKKLLEYLDSELCDRQASLTGGETPTFGDIQRLARTGHRIHQVLVRNGIINHP
jgi:hypothetical protein